LLLKLWCKGKNFYDKGQGINAEPLTYFYGNIWQIMAIKKLLQYRDILIIKQLTNYMAILLRKNIKVLS